MTLYELKPRFQSLIRPLSNRLAKTGVSANQITVLAAIGSVIVGLLVAGYSHAPAVLLLVPAWLGIRMMLNAIDGMIAREHGLQSSLGAYLNEIMDGISDTALYLPFAHFAPGSSVAVVLVVLLSILAELAGVAGQAMGASRRFDGPMGKSDRALVFGLLALLYGTAVAPPVWLTWAMYAVAGALVLTILNRVRSGLAEIEVRREQA